MYAELPGLSYPDGWERYHAERMEILHDPITMDAHRMSNGPLDSAHTVTLGHLLRHRPLLWAMRRELVARWNPPEKELLIIAPAADLGPAGDGVTFLGMRVRAEHSATTYRVIWERPL